MTTKRISLVCVIGLMGLEFSPCLSWTAPNNFVFRRRTTAVRGVRSVVSSSSALAGAARFECYTSDKADPNEAVQDLLAGGVSDTLSPNNDDKNQDIAFLFVGPYHADSFPEITKQASSLLLEENTRLIGVLGGGVVGGGKEVDDEELPCMSLLRGRIPKGGRVLPFHHSNGASLEKQCAHLRLNEAATTTKGSRPSSYLVFPDPYYARTQEIFDFLDGTSSKSTTNNKRDGVVPVVAGGISAPQKMGQPSLSIDGTVLPSGAVVGVEFSGNIGLQVLVAQGCRPVGPTFQVTGGARNRLTELSGEPAIKVLEKVAAEAKKTDQELIRNGQLLCGLHHHHHHQQSSNEEGDDKDNDHNDDDDDDDVDEDFLVRKIMGFQPKSGSILLSGQVREGDTFRFHVWAKNAAMEDMDLMIQRAKTERLVLGQGTKALAALQFSCIARGQILFKAPNVDLEKVQTLLDNDDSPVAGFFANGEIGPVGIRMAPAAATDRKSATYLHAFTTVAAILCDLSNVDLEMDTVGVFDDANAWA